MKNVCGLSPARTFESPLGPLEIDIERNEALNAHNLKYFNLLSSEADGREHSLEMQFPLIKHTFPEAKVLPIMIGHLDDAVRRAIAKCLLEALPSFESNTVKFVISSDFCHFGARFGYYGGAQIHNSNDIKNLDMSGFEALSSASHFKAYLQSTGNTICGREPILLFLEMLEATKISHSGWKLLEYSQSNTITSASDSSVSYLSASLSLEKK
jgi:AmmeMemoRadiSam system protein B